MDILDITSIWPNIDHESWIYFKSPQYGTALVMDILDITLIWHIMTRFWWTNISKLPKSQPSSIQMLRQTCGRSKQRKTPWIGKIYSWNEHFNWQIAGLLMNSLGGRHHDTETSLQVSNIYQQLVTCQALSKTLILSFELLIWTSGFGWTNQTAPFFLTMALHAHHLKR